MQLSKVIFWDTNYEQINWDTKARYVIARVIMYGTLDDWHTIKQYYGLETIKNEMSQERDLDDKSLSFLSCIYNIPKQQFRCYNYKQSTKPHWTY